MYKFIVLHKCYLKTDLRYSSFCFEIPGNSSINERKRSYERAKYLF